MSLPKLFYHYLRLISASGLTICAIALVLLALIFIYTKGFQLVVKAKEAGDALSGDPIDSKEKFDQSTPNQRKKHLEKMKSKIKEKLRDRWRKKPASGKDGADVAEGTDEAEVVEVSDSTTSAQSLKSPRAKKND